VLLSTIPIIQKQQVQEEVDFSSKNARKCWLFATRYTHRQNGTHRRRHYPARKWELPRHAKTWEKKGGPPRSLPSDEQSGRGHRKVLEWQAVPDVWTICALPRTHISKTPRAISRRLRLDKTTNASLRSLLLYLYVSPLHISRRCDKGGTRWNSLHFYSSSLV